MVEKNWFLNDSLPFVLGMQFDSPYPVEDYFLFPPNWNNPVSFKRRWKTTIQSALEANEGRSALLTWPRRAISYSLSEGTYTKSAFIKRKIYKNLGKIFGIPLWQDRTVLVATAASGQNVLSVESTQSRNFEVGASCILFESESSYEVGLIWSKTATSITLVTNLVQTWGSGVEVFPMLKARISNDTQELILFTSRVFEMRIEAVEEFDDGIERNVGGAGGYWTYGGVPLFDKVPNWKEGMPNTFVHPYSSVSFLGKSEAFTHIDETDLGIKAKYLATSKQDIQEYLDFFDSQKGRWGNFWFPSWQDDILVTAAFNSSATQLTIEDIQFSSMWLGTKAGSYIFISWPNGEWVVRKIIGASSSTLIDLDKAVGKGCSVDELSSLLVSFLFMGRFDQDEIEVKYVTDEVGEIELSFKTLFADTYPSATSTSTTSSSTSTTSSTVSSISTTSSTTTSSSTTTAP